MKVSVLSFVIVLGVATSAAAQGTVQCSTTYMGPYAYTNCHLPVQPDPAARINPWIPLSGQPAPRQTPLDMMGQLLAIQRQAAELRLLQQAATPVIVPAPVPPPQGSSLWARRARALGIAPPPAVPALPATAADDGWMSGFIKGVQ